MFWGLLGAFIGVGFALGVLAFFNRPYMRIYL